MNSNSFCDEIKNLVSNAKLNDAITQLNLFAEHNKWLKNDIIMQSFRLTDLENQIIRGLVSFDDSNNERNRISYAILQIVDKILKNNNYSLDKIIQTFGNRTIKEEVLDVAEIICSVSNEILIENQSILTLRLTRREEVHSVTGKMTNLFNNQKKRGDFARWLTILENYSSQNDLPNGLKKEIQKLHEILSVFHSKLYAYIPNFSTRNINDDYKIDKFIMTQLHYFTESEIDNLISSYLEDLRNTIDKIAVSTEKIRLT